jgi:hypothetical protein
MVIDEENVGIRAPGQSVDDANRASGGGEAPNFSAGAHQTL